MIARVDAGTMLATHVHDKVRTGQESQRPAQGDGADRQQLSQAKPKHQQQQQQQPLQRGLSYPDHFPKINKTSSTSSAHLPVQTTKPTFRPTYTPRGHLRSRSSNSAAPSMSRAHSFPLSHSGQNPASSIASPAPRPRPSSPLLSPRLRSISPLHRQTLPEDTHPATMISPPLYDGGIASISEDAELDTSPRLALDQLPQPIPFHTTLNSARSLSVRRQRPSSPLHSIASANYAAIPTTPRSSSASSSPSFPTAPRFNEGYPSLNHYASNSSFSSVPTTPTSTRSRSPSVSSLETIEDAPDLEWEAIEADRENKLRAAAQAVQEAGEGDGRRRGSLDIPGTRSGVGFGFGKRGDSGKKRWSVCGGERRADLDLETIWED